MIEKRAVDALILGGGPAGLSAAARLKRLGVPSVLVCERERQAGGVPRYTNHVSFGMSDLHRVTTGPRYASELVRRAEASGVEIQTETTVHTWCGTRTVQVSSPRGLCDINAKAILLATGCRETPRSARLVPGTRPAGIFTTSSLQHFSFDYNTCVGKNAVVVGAEHVSFSGVHTLQAHGCRVSAMLTQHSNHQTFFPLKFFVSDLGRIPILLHSKVTNILGKERLEAIEVTDLSNGSKRTIDADTVVFSGEFVPEYEQACAAGVDLDGGTWGPAVDFQLRTGQEGIFAAGNVLRGAEASGIAAREGIYAAERVAVFLERENWPAHTTRVVCRSPLAYTSPNRIALSQTSPPPWLMTWRVDRFVAAGRLIVEQGSRRLYERRVRNLVPNRRLRLCPVSWLDDVAPDGPDVIAKIE